MLQNSKSLNLQRSLLLKVIDKRYMFEQQQRNAIASEGDDDDDDKMEFHGLTVLLILNNTILMYFLHVQVLKPLDDDRIRMVRMCACDESNYCLCSAAVHSFACFSFINL